VRTPFPAVLPPMAWPCSPPISASASATAITIFAGSLVMAAPEKWWRIWTAPIRRADAASALPLRRTNIRGNGHVFLESRCRRSDFCEPVGDQCPGCDIALHHAGRIVGAAHRGPAAGIDGGGPHLSGDGCL